MKRSDFLKTSIPVAFLPAFINGFSIKSYGASPLMRALMSSDNDHVLVLIQLNGGNDGLNTLIPLDQYGALANVRSNVLIPQNRVLSLTGISNNGLHPSMTGIRNLFNEGKVSIVQGVGYPDQNFSHFRSTDIWLTGSDADQVVTSGWVGRYLNNEYPNFPTGYPNTDMPDPLAIQLGAIVSPAFQGPVMNMGFAISDPTDFYNLLNGIQAPAPATCAGDELTYIRTVAQQTTQYASVIKTATENVTQQAAYPSNNNLADQLKIVARLIAGGLKTKVYMVSIGGFDTHSMQVDAADTTLGAHATLLSQLSEAVSAFMNDLEYLSIENRVMAMTFSEFGRRIISNFSLGTDHGAAAPMFIFGSKATPGIVGDNPVIPSNANAADNLPMQYDFRSVYATMLQDWLCVPSAELNSILLNNFQTLPLVDASACNPTSTRDINRAAGLELIKAYPNPFVASTTIQYTTNGGHTLIHVMNCEGRVIKTLVDTEMNSGTYTAWFENEGYAPGIYYARLQNGPVQQVKAMMLAR